MDKIYFPIGLDKRRGGSFRGGLSSARDEDGKVYVFDAWQLAVNNVIRVHGFDGQGPEPQVREVEVIKPNCLMNAGTWVPFRCV